MALISYYQQLEAAAKKAGVPLLKAYLRAGFPDSTYYRHKIGSHDPRLASAERIMQSIAREFEDEHGIAFDHAA